MSLRLETDGVSNATVNREAAFVRGMLSRAVEWNIISVNPLSGIKLLKESGKRDVSLNQDQAIALLQHLPLPIDDIVEFAINTGFRRENILSLRLEQVTLSEDNSSGIISLTIKGGRNEIFPH